MFVFALERRIYDNREKVYCHYNVGAGALLSLSVSVMRRKLAKEQIKTIIDAIRESSKNTKELRDYLKAKGKSIPEKTFYRILTEYLPLWGLAYKDEDGRWSWFLKKQPFENKHAYDLAIEHSKRIMFGESDSRDGEVYWGIPANINTFERYAQGTWKTDNAHVTEFLQHLKTGYPDLFAQLEEFKELYRQRQEIMQRIESKNPEHFQKYWLFDQFPTFLKEQDEARIRFFSSLGGNGVDAHKKALEKQRAEYGSVFSEEDLKRLVELEERLMAIYEKGGGKLLRIEKTVQNETPLEGWCDYCPDKLVTIKSEE
jgi:hypothetical protein